MRDVTPGYWVLTATSRPSASRARCTCEIEAAARGVASNSEKTSATGRPSSLVTAPSMTEAARGGTRSCSEARLSTKGVGRRSGRVEANWPALIRVPPSAPAVSSNRPAPRRWASSQSSGRTSPGHHRARSRSAAYPRYTSLPPPCR
jgi:hypothetical protein